MQELPGRHTSAGQKIAYLSIKSAVGRLNSYRVALPRGRGVFGSAENIPYTKERPGAKRPATECKTHS